MGTGPGNAGRDPGLQEAEVSCVGAAGVCRKGPRKHCVETSGSACREAQGSEARVTPMNLGCHTSGVESSQSQGGLLCI